ncbi:MAG TPA: cytochrome c [Terriglobia bacterium]|nr:cytochrome c [Terriglobia bacterium]
MKLKILRTLLMLPLGMGSLWAQARHPSDQKTPAPSGLPAQGLGEHYKPNVPPQERARKNPVRFTELPVDRGKRLFQTQCVLCHGVNADGKGDFVGVYGVHPPDFTRSGVLSKRTDGELFYIIGAGTEKMPGKHTQLTEQQRWDVVNYLRALEGKIPAPRYRATGRRPRSDLPR